MASTQRSTWDDVTWSHSSVQKSKCPNPRPQVFSQIPGGGKGNRGQMPTYARGPPCFELNIDWCIMMDIVSTMACTHCINNGMYTLYQQWHVNIILHELNTPKHSFIPYFVLSNNLFQCKTSLALYSKDDPWNATKHLLKEIVTRADFWLVVFNSDSLISLASAKNKWSWASRLNCVWMVLPVRFNNNSKDNTSTGEFLLLSCNFRAFQMLSHTFRYFQIFPSRSAELIRIEMLTCERTTPRCNLPLEDKLTLGKPACKI